jgi:hypothetical protein
MKMCSACDRPVCDLCIWYAFNGDDCVYTGDGFCRINGQPRDPDDGCENFVCCCWYSVVPVVKFDGWCDG